MQTTTNNTKLTANDIAALFSEGWQEWPTEQISEVCKPRHFRYLSAKQTEWLKNTARRARGYRDAVQDDIASGILPGGQTWTATRIAYKANAKFYVTPATAEAPATMTEAPAPVNSLEALTAERIRRVEAATVQYADDDDRLEAELDSIKAWFRAERAKL